jgi:hypothetical protein
MKQLLCLFLLLLPYGMTGYAQGVNNTKARQILNDASYLTGEGIAQTREEAVGNAIANLLSKVRTSVSASITERMQEQDNNGAITSESIVTSVLKSYTQGALRNTEEICLSTSPEFHIMVYMKRTEMDQIFSERVERVKDYVRSAVSAEEKGRIDNALRYYFWAYNLLSSVQTPGKVKFNYNGGDVYLQNWIPEQMREIFGKLSVKMGAYDKKSGEAELLVTYAEKPVTSLDFSYFDGTQWSNPTSAKDGMAQIELRPDAPVENVQVKYEYEYKEQARQDGELEMVINIFSDFPMPQANCIIKTGSKSDAKQTARQLAETVSNEGLLNNTNKVEKKHNDYAVYLSTIEKVIEAIRDKNYGKIRQLFTPEGYQMFDQLVHYGKGMLIGNPSISFYQYQDKVVARSIPMKFSFKNNNRTFVEDLTLTFNAEKQIESLAFGLDQAAKNDIFNKSIGQQWNDDVRMTIATFLENYKTAFALKRLGYIESIFDDNAIIITGAYVKQARHNLENDKYIGNKYVKYNRMNKQSYLKRLKTIFGSNEFINVRFADNDIEKMGNGGELYGIQIHQDYYSSSYSDTGYLFLMIDMNNPSQPSIMVRTWQPERDPNVNSHFNRNDRFYGLFYGGNFD